MRSSKIPAGTYRQLHARLRTNAEPVAFYGGVEKEGSLITSKFQQLVKHQLKLLNTQWRFAMWQVRVDLGFGMEMLRHPHPLGPYKMLR